MAVSKKRAIKTISVEQLKKTLVKQDTIAFRLRNRQRSEAETLRSVLMYGTASELQTKLTGIRIKNLISLTRKADEAEGVADKLYNKVQAVEQASTELLK